MDTKNKDSLRRRRVLKLSIVLVVAAGLTTLGALANSKKKPVEPVMIEVHDMCSFCRMSISEKRYAAELIDSEGQALKFDDIACMANYIKQKNNNSSIVATFVMDFDRREWLKAENAFYVRSSDFKTPMNGGIVAFGDQSGAQAAAAKYNGAMLKFADLTK